MPCFGVNLRAPHGEYDYSNYGNCGDYRDNYSRKPDAGFGGGCDIRGDRRGEGAQRKRGGQYSAEQGKNQDPDGYLIPRFFECNIAVHSKNSFREVLFFLCHSYFFSANRRLLREIDEK